MRQKMRWLSVLVIFGSTLCAQDLSGDWQGTLKVGAQDLRLIVKIVKGDDVRWKATIFSIDQGIDRGAGIAVNSLTLQGADLRFTAGEARAKYQGKLSADGATIAGTWTQGRPVPLELHRTTAETAWKDPSPHTTQFVTVDHNVKLEVLDWGGSGRPLVLLAGLGGTAHVFDKFAPKLIAKYHVYGITRRGFGASSAPASGYSADRLGDDVLAVLDGLKLSRPVLVGHSIAGEELSSVGSRHPEKVAGLVYLDAGYGYAYYDRSRGFLDVDLADLKKKLEQLQPGREPQNAAALIQDMLETVLPGFERDLREEQKDLRLRPTAQATSPASIPAPEAEQAILAGMQKYTKIPVPILAVFAVPHDLGPLRGNDFAARAAIQARDTVTTEAQAKAFESGLPSARVVRLPHADHNVFLSNEAEVLREMNAFLASLP
jgi:non-heme chloroperoxidase